MNELIKLVKFDEKGLVPSIIQDYKSKEVLTLCYMNREALEKTLEEGKIYVFRRSKRKLMMKGETSGCTQAVRFLYIDCEGNSILFMVDQEKAACHEGYFTCYFRQIDKSGNVKIKGKRIFDPKEVYPAKPKPPSSSCGCPGRDSLKTKGSSGLQAEERNKKP